MNKEIYHSPKMEALGSFESLTQSTNSGTKVDAAFAAQAPSVLGALS